MESNISVSENGQYIILKVRGDLDRASSIKQIIEAHELGTKLGIQNYLADLTEARSVRSILDDYHLANADTHRDPRIITFARVAMLVSPEDHSHDFLEIAALNAGWRVKLFKEKTKALDYLMKARHTSPLFSQST